MKGHDSSLRSSDLLRVSTASPLDVRPVSYTHLDVYKRQVFTQLGELGLLSLAYPEQYGGGEQPYEVYLQVIEEIASAWMSVAVCTSVHSLTCFPMYTFCLLYTSRCV